MFPKDQLTGRILKKKTIIVLLSLLAVLALIRLSLPSIGRFLVIQNSSESSDLIVILMGSGPDRMLEAVDLYQAGYGKTIVMVENNQPGYYLLQKRGVNLPRDTYLAKSVGVQLGVPEKSFVILPGDALSTLDEADQVADYLKQHSEIKSVILVTSRYHSTRALNTFKFVFSDFDRDIRVLSCPSHYDTFNADEWWRSREDAKHVVSEYLKLLNFYLFDS